MGTNCGFVTVAPSADPVAGNFQLDRLVVTLKDTSPATAAKVVEIGVWVDNATEASDFEFGIYEHNPGDDNPEALLVGKVTIAKGTTSGWKKQTCNITISPSTIYWIAAQLDNTATATSLNGTNSTGERTSLKTAVAVLPDPYGVGAESDRTVSIYAKWEAGAPAGNAGIMTTNTGFWGPTF